MEYMRKYIKYNFPCTIMFADPNTGESCPFRMQHRSSRHGINNYIKILSREHETNRILTEQDYGQKESHNNSHSIKPIATVQKTMFSRSKSDRGKTFTTDEPKTKVLHSNLNATEAG